jgi:hypothetical protein
MWRRRPKEPQHTVRLLVDGPLSASSSGALTIRFAFRIDGWCFPEDRWRDCVIEAAESWPAALAELGARGNATLHFIEGPFEVRLYVIGPDAVIAEFVSCTGADPVLENRVTLSRRHLATAVTAGFQRATELLDRCGRVVEAEILRRKTGPEQRNQSGGSGSVLQFRPPRC